MKGHVQSLAVDPAEYTSLTNVWTFNSADKSRVQLPLSPVAKRVERAEDVRIDRNCSAFLEEESHFELQGR